MYAISGSGRTKRVSTTSMTLGFFNKLFASFPVHLFFLTSWSNFHLMLFFLITFGFGVFVLFFSHNKSFFNFSYSEYIYHIVSGNCRTFGISRHEGIAAQKLFIDSPWL